jgi:hypothetical protein
VSNCAGTACIWCPNGEVKYPAGIDASSICISSDVMCLPGQWSNEGDARPKSVRGCATSIEPSAQVLSYLPVAASTQRPSVHPRRILRPAPRTGVCKNCPNGQVGNALDTACIWCPNGEVKYPAGNDGTGSCVSSVTTISANAWECGPGQWSNEGELPPQCEAARRALNRLYSCPSLRALTDLCTCAASAPGVCKDCPALQMGNLLDTACVWCPGTPIVCPV